MSIQALPRPAVSPALEAARGSLAEAGEVALGVVGDDDLTAAIEGATECMRRAEALRLAFLAEADRRQLAEREAATGTDAWAAALTGDRRAMLAGGLWLRRLLEERYAATREAFAAGRIGVAQVQVIVRAAEQAPTDATDAQVRAGEELLVAKATGDATRNGRPMDSRRLRQAARRMFATIDADLALRHEAIMLGREHRQAEHATYIVLGDNGDGTFSGRFCIPELHGHLLTHALHRLTAPRRLGRDASGRTVVDESAPSSANLHEQHGAALCELLEHLPTTGHAANGTTLLVTIHHDRLVDALGSAGLDTGTRISAGEARRLACGAGIMPVVLGGASVPLDLGRRRRLHSNGQRNALGAVHDSCGIDTCDRPFAWCEIHHLQEWSRGGRTDLADAVPLCAHHHRCSHDTRFVLSRQPGGGWRLHPRR